MTGMNEFIELFGGLTVANVVTIVLAGFFLWKGYLQLKKYFENKAKIEQEKEDSLNTCLEAIKKYPEYRQQSKEMQNSLQGQIDELKSTQVEIVNGLKDMRSAMEKRERNKLRSKLLQYYRAFANPEKNPSQSWTVMESDAFWQLFKDYEELNGDGYMHTEVQPAMNKLTVIDMFSE